MSASSGSRRLTTPSDTEIVGVREFDAPRDLVYKVFTDPTLIPQWWGPRGLSELPQLGDWSEWARQLTVDLPALGAYAQAVYANTDAFLAGLTPADLGGTVDLSIFGYRAVPLPLFILTFVGGHAAMHAGEISCLKGLQGLRGYPS